MAVLRGAEARRILERYPVERLFSRPVGEYLSVHRIRRGEYLFRGDADANRLYFLVEGRAKTYILHPNGSESLLAFPGPGTVMGDMELVGARTEPYLVQALTDCVAVTLALALCREQVLSDAAFLLRLCRLLSDKLYAEDARLSAQQAFPLLPKLADFILRTQADGLYAEPLVRTAQYLGASERHLQRLLTDLCGQGCLTRLGRSRYRVTGPDRLRELAGEMNQFQEAGGFLQFL